MFSEILRKQINVNKHEDSVLSWNNHVLGISGHKKLHLIDFSYNLYSLEKEIDIKEYFLSASHDSPVPTNFLSNYATRGIKNLELMEMITNPAFWPHHKLLAQEMTNIIGYKWSPYNLIGNQERILATVNSVGNVEFFAYSNQMWTSIMDFSAEMKNHLNLTIDMLDKCPKKFTEMKDIVYSSETSTICWAPELNYNKSCYLATIQKSGEIHFWLLKDHDTLNSQFCGSIQNSNKFEVPFVIWIPLDEDKFLFIFSNECGQVIANKFKIVDEKITLLQEYSIWPHKDKMMVTYLDFIFDNNNLIICFHKHRHLILQMYDRTLKLISQCVKNVNDYRISSITKCNKNEFYVCTVNTKIYKIEYNIINNVIELNLIPIEIKESYPKCDLFGLGFSKNNAMITLGLFDRQLVVRKQPIKVDIVFLCPETELETDTLLILNNPTKKIINVWDHIEVLRCKIIKSKRLPDIDYGVLLKDGESNVYNLKVYLVFLIFYHSLEKMMTSCLKGKFPETSITVIKERILLFQCINVINSLNAKYEQKSILSDFEKECFEYSKRFLYYYCKNYSKNLKDFISNDELNVPCSQIEHTCQACDEIITDFSCKNEHLNMFCSLTLTPIEQDDFLICKSCDSTARIELYGQNPTCVFCDISLNKSV